MNSAAWVLVTGGAKRIGAFLNQEFAKSGKNIVLHYNHSETAAIALKAQLETLNIKVVLWQSNLDDPATIEQRFEALLAQVPHIELLINSASVFGQGSLLESSLAQIQSNLNIHLTSPWLLIQALVKQNKPCQFRFCEFVRVMCACWVGFIQLVRMCLMSFILCGFGALTRHRKQKLLHACTCAPHQCEFVCRRVQHGICFGSFPVENLFLACLVSLF